MTLDVVCPDGVCAGDTIKVQAASGTFEVVVPDGVSPGTSFSVELPSNDAVDDYVSMQTMDVASAELLRAVLQAIIDDDTLDDFVDAHSENFKDYDADGEQSLEWGSLHREYVAHVEHTLSTVLAHGRSSAEDLYALLESQRHSIRGQRFLDRFLAMGDYPTFCQMMCTWANLETVHAQSRFIDEEQAAIDQL